RACFMALRALGGLLAPRGLRAGRLALPLTDGACGTTLRADMGTLRNRGPVLRASRALATPGLLAFQTENKRPLLVRTASNRGLFPRSFGLVFPLFFRCFWPVFPPWAAPFWGGAPPALSPTLGGRRRVPRGLNPLFQFGGCSQGAPPGSSFRGF